MSALLTNTVAAAVLSISIVWPAYIDQLHQWLLGPENGAEQVLMPEQTEVPARPQPGLHPAEVVSITLDALRTNDRPYHNAGIETAYTFSSPANRENSGPMEQFVELVRSAVYEPMLNHQSARLGQVDVDGNEAWIPVVIVSEQAEKFGYTFQLVRQVEGPYIGCWMVEGVFPFDVEEIDEPPLLVTA